jgi:hypothetical protein
MIYLLTAIGLSPGGSSTIHIYSQTIHRTTQITTEQHKKNNYFGRVPSVPRLCEFYSGICLTAEEKARKNLSQGKKNLSQSTVYLLPKHPHITKATHTHTRTRPHITKPTHYKAI